jgi:phthalate 4,5-dioxygenase
MGPPERAPALPEWEFAFVPAQQRFVSKRLQEYDLPQAMESGIDSSHVAFLHRGNIDSDPLFKGPKGNRYTLRDSRPVFEGGGERQLRELAASCGAEGHQPSVRRVR